MNHRLLDVKPSRTVRGISLYFVHTQQCIIYTFFSKKVGPDRDGDVFVSSFFLL